MITRMRMSERIYPCLTLDFTGFQRAHYWGWCCIFWRYSIGSSIGCHGEYGQRPFGNWWSWYTMGSSSLGFALWLFFATCTDLKAAFLRELFNVSFNPVTLDSLFIPNGLEQVSQDSGRCTEVCLQHGGMHGIYAWDFSTILSFDGIFDFRSVGGLVLMPSGALVI